MAISSILNIQQIAENQSNKYITHNDAIEALVKAGNKLYTNSSVGSGPVTLSDDDASRHFAYRVSGAAAAFNLVFPSVINSVNAKRVFAVRNEDTTYACTVKASSGSGATVVVQPGSAALIAQDYETMYALSIGPTATTPYDFGFYILGKPDAGAVVMQFVAVRAISLPINFAGSRGKVGTNPTASAAFDVLKNGSSIGSITVGTGGAFTFAVASATSLAAGDYLSITAPSPQDATMANITINLTGTRAL